jgi:putative ABC transport system substrate-binding protein
VIRGLLAIMLVSVLAVPQSFAARADEPAQRIVRVGFVAPTSSSSDPRFLSAFRERLRELGYVEGQNLIIELRWAEGHYDRLPALMDEVVGHKIDVLVTFGTPATRAAKKTTNTVPIVAAVIGDPVGASLVTSLAHPGGNVTGLSAGWDERFIGKLLELLKEIVPRLSTIAVIRNPNNPATRRQAEALIESAPKLGVKIRIIDVRESSEFERAFAEAARRSEAVVVLADPIIRMHKQKVVALAAKHRLAAIFPFPDFVEAGGLMAYGPDFVVLFRHAADYVDKILRGAKPADLPIEEPTRYVLSVNLKTARSLGLTIPESILLRADEVIR